ncbi:MAG: hypothetical protein COV75_05290 [Candidatus Omnitrophica bacterium CG11_big_fil_rev_8_21_14_0_20_63_9]|nr:MAG: hypothetical protein COV75_05290 [Candidatus Omnitrophica bacterium CG11_big_fil_rev_8_21_14_0_20_63_9]
MLARTRSYTTFGVEALPIEVEVDASRGLPGLAIVGLPDQAIQEAKERVRAAILNSQYQLPGRRVIVNLAPADVKKEGAVFDLAIALGLLAVSEQVDPARLAGVLVLGELALDGRVRPVPGVLPIALACRGSRRPLLVCAGNAAEASAVSGLDVVPIATLQEAVEYLAGTRPITPRRRGARPRTSRPLSPVDFSDVNGQAQAIRALQVAVAGGHHALLIGPPGSGKTMLAQRIPTIQPEFTHEESLEASAIHSVAGLLGGRPLLDRRPFRAPHHTSSAIALIGGGPLPKPGEISLAHHGVLFLDELPEFHRDVLESLRQPLEEGSVRIARARRTLSFPARFMLVGAMNPCPCGHAMSARGRCRCPATKVQGYLGKVSGPLLDRIDVHIEVPAVPGAVLAAAPRGPASMELRAQVAQARRRQLKRLKRFAVSLNAHVRHRDLRAVCPMSADASRLLPAAMEELRFSARSYDKILRIARTIADLEDIEVIQPSHLAEAIQYRSIDRQLWA